MTITAIIRTHDLRADKRDFLELLATDLPAIYGARLPALLRGQAVVMGKMLHRVVRVDG